MEPGFDTLCDFLILGVFSKLNPKILLRVRETCARWNNISYDWSLWRKLELPGVPYMLSVSEVEEILDIAGPIVRSMTIPPGYLDVSESDTNHIFTCMNQKCSSLHDLTMSLQLKFPQLDKPTQLSLPHSSLKSLSVILIPGAGYLSTYQSEMNLSFSPLDLRLENVTDLSVTVSQPLGNTDVLRWGWGLESQIVPYFGETFAPIIEPCFMSPIEYILRTTVGIMKSCRNAEHVKFISYLHVPREASYYAVKKSAYARLWDVYFKAHHFLRCIFETDYSPLTPSLKTYSVCVPLPHGPWAGNYVLPLSTNCFMRRYPDVRFIFI